MAALVQTIPQQSTTVSVLAARPSSSSATFTPSSPSPQSASRSQTMSWSTLNAGNNSGSYRGRQVVAPYAFTSTPNLASSQNRRSWSPHLSPDHRTIPAPSGGPGNHNNGHPSRLVSHVAAGSVSTPSSSNSSLRSVSKDDTVIPARHSSWNDPALRPLSTAKPPTLPPINTSTLSSKPPPDRYRRGSRGVSGGPPTNVPTSPTVSSTTLDSHASSSQCPSSSADRQNSSRNVPRVGGHGRGSSTDETAGTEKQQPELAKRYRRRSVGTVDSANLLNMECQVPKSETDLSNLHPRDAAIRPRSIHSQRDSTGSIESARSSSSSVHDSGRTEPVSSSRTSKPDHAKRLSKPSPLSQPVPAAAPQTTKTPDASGKEKKAATASNSPATQRLADINSHVPEKSGKSRLRRAFSFGSASDLIKASSHNNALSREAMLAEQARRQQLKEELGAEHAAIAEKQEAGGLGESIYSSRQSYFTRGSTDELSISSTASSASIMLRKMGKGMKRSTRSLVGLFRPKSSHHHSVEATVGPMEPTLSVVNVEADKKKAPVKPTLQDIPRATAALPRIGIDNWDATNSGSSREAPAVNSRSHLRQSIVGGDRERAEVLAAVNNRKGILKKSYSDSAASSATAKPNEGCHSRNGSDSPHSSVPSTPVDQSSRKNDGITIAGEDYFTSQRRTVGPEASSVPVSPQPVVKNIVFSPRIQFFETWPSGEYDRRADIATCNRLTPLLAQQIKEELNNFKLEMEVHEMSKVYTHFI